VLVAVRWRRDEHRALVRRLRWQQDVIIVVIAAVQRLTARERWRRERQIADTVITIAFGKGPIGTIKTVCRFVTQVLLHGSLILIVALTFDTPTLTRIGQPDVVAVAVPADKVQLTLTIAQGTVVPSEFPVPEVTFLVVTCPQMVTTITFDAVAYTVTLAVTLTFTLTFTLTLSLAIVVTKSSAVVFSSRSVP